MSGERGRGFEPEQEMLAPDGRCAFLAGLESGPAHTVSNELLTQWQKRVSILGGQTLSGRFETHRVPANPVDDEDSSTANGDASVVRDVGSVSADSEQFAVSEPPWIRSPDCYPAVIDRQRGVTDDRGLRPLDVARRRNAPRALALVERERR